MQIGPVTLEGRHVRLEPVSLAHVPALWRVGAYEELWRYIPYVVHSEDEMRAYIESELAKQQAGLVVRFTTIAKAIAEPVGSTSYLNIDRQHRRLVDHRRALTRRRALRLSSRIGSGVLIWPGSIAGIR